MKPYFTYIICGLLALSASAHEKGGKSGDDLRFEAYYAEAQRQWSNENIDAAYELLNYCKQLNPKAPEIFHSLSPMNMFLEKDSIAIADLNMAVELEPGNYWYSNLLARVYLSSHRPAEAIKVLEQMDRRWKLNPVVMYMLQDAYASQNMPDSVLSVLQRMEVREGKNDNISLEKIKIYTQQNDVKGILEELETLVKASPTTDLPATLLPQLLKNKSDAFSLLGDIYQKAGNYERSFQYYDSCLVYNPDDAMALNNYAYYLSLQNTNLDEAEIMSRKSNELEPDNPTYLDTLAWILYLKGNYAEANRYIDRTLELMKPEELEEADDVKEHLKKIKGKQKQ